MGIVLARDGVEMDVEFLLVMNIIKFDENDESEKAVTGYTLTAYFE